ncbi:hypothetical protein IH781_03960 [Patescibacteria group bacterium]|nr:hypothetical protein [Patescibacteria group bacterium]
MTIREERRGGGDRRRYRWKDERERNDEIVERETASIAEYLLDEGLIKDRSGRKVVWLTILTTLRDIAVSLRCLADKDAA